MTGKSYSVLTRASPPPPADANAIATSTGPARATLLQPVRTRSKRDGEADGLPGRAGQRNKPASEASHEPASPKSPRSPSAPSFAEPLTSPVRTPLNAAGADPFGSPVTPKIHVGFLKAMPASPTRNADAYDMLTTKLNRPDLYALTTQLDDQVGVGNWSFTGSVALQLHGMNQNQGPGRPPDDADVEIDQIKFDFFTEKVKRIVGVNGVENALQRKCDANGREEHHTFGGTLKVDLISLKPRQNETERRQLVSGIPVHSLTVLKSRKENYGDKTTAADDLQRINALLASQGVAPG